MSDDQLSSIKMNHTFTCIRSPVPSLMQEERRKEMSFAVLSVESEQRSLRSFSQKIMLCDSPNPGAKQHCRGLSYNHACDDGA